MFFSVHEGVVKRTVFYVIHVNVSHFLYVNTHVDLIRPFKPNLCGHEIF